ncbi:alpha-ketoacid dehydrogenase subunit beta [Azospirillum sp.]|uniref:alpha-ketoacid dehydrogenase subunit beta n=1 Tax=Azospirillum sp. TaxID=34012 RepID=UPI003D74EE9E
MFSLARAPAPVPGPRTLTTMQALNEALDLAMERDGRVFAIGQGALPPLSLFGATQNLLEKYGPDRIVESPLSENAMTGVAVGAALMGRRPVLFHIRADFALLGLEQLFNNAAKMAFLSKGARPVPLVVRLYVGRGWGQGPAHGRSLEALFAAEPGLKVVMPSDPASAKGLLLASIEDPNPVVFIEHRWLHFLDGPVPEGYWTEPLDGPKLRRRGSDVTIVGTSWMLRESRRAAEALAGAGVSCEVIDLAVLRPFRPEMILDSVRRTGRLIVADTGWTTLGMGSEIVATVTERAFGALRRAPVRIGQPDRPTPSAPALAAEHYPTALTVFDAAARLVDAAPERVAAARAALAAETAGQPADLPHPDVRAPF